MRTYACSLVDFYFGHRIAVYFMFMMYTLQCMSYFGIIGWSAVTDRVRHVPTGGLVVKLERNSSLPPLHPTPSILTLYVVLHNDPFVVYLLHTFWRVAVHVCSPSLNTCDRFGDPNHQFYDCPPRKFAIDGSELSR